MVKTFILKNFSKHFQQIRVLSDFLMFRILYLYFHLGLVKLYLIKFNLSILGIPMTSALIRYST